MLVQIRDVEAQSRKFTNVPIKWSFLGKPKKRHTILLQWRNWDDFNVDTYQKSSWGSGGRCEPPPPPPAGLGAAPRKFLKFMVSFTSEDLFWQILENFLGLLLQKFSANERSVCNCWTCDCLLPSLVCVGTERPRNSSPCFLSATWVRCPLASIPTVYFYSTSTLQLLNNVRTLVFFDVDKGVATSHHWQVCLLLCMNLRSPIARPKLSFS